VSQWVLEYRLLSPCFQRSGFFRRSSELGTSQSTDIMSYAYPPQPSPPSDPRVYGQAPHERASHAPFYDPSKATAPSPHPGPTLPTSTQWTSGLYDCCADCGICCLTYNANPVVHGLIVARLERTGCCAPCCVWYITSPCCLHLCLWGPQRRRSVREKFGLREEPCGGEIQHLSSQEMLNFAISRSFRDISRYTSRKHVDTGQTTRRHVGIY
jgi:Cys-rich protein (TIGR01571 family)